MTDETRTTQRWQPGSPPLHAPDFESLITGEPVVVLHFWADWDRHDRAFDAALQPIREEFANQVAFRSVDVDQAEFFAICHACGVLNIPAVVCFVRGHRVSTTTGLRSTPQLRELISGLVADDG